jgi:peptide/nickel transport system ATP-binding protein
VIADEPTTALDVTIQAQVLDLFARLTRERGTAVLIITHDMGVVAEMTSRVLVMYGGQIVERCSTETLFGNPRMPYTWGLIDSVLRMDGDRRTRLRSIEGLPPTLDPPPPGCRFAARCAYRRDICSEQDPALLPLRAGDHSHEVRCWGAHDIEGGGWLRESTFGLATDVPVVVSPISARPASHSSSHDHRAAAPLGNAVAGGALLTVRKLTVDFPLGGASLLTRRRSVLRAVDGVELTLHRGRTLGIVGESGCGKSTLARAILRLQDPTDGSICFDGIELTTLTGRAMRRLRRRMQMIPQDPHRSLDPRRTVGDAVSEAIQTHHMAERSEVADRVAQLLVGVGLDTSFLERYPHQLSGGQRQRVGIARALAVEPELIVADEPVSTLDVSVQAQIINLMRDVQTNFGLSLIFIAHDLAVVRHISDEVAVMYLGRVIEFGDAAAIFGDPRHPYTRALMSAVPLPYSVGRRRTPRIILDGELPSPASIPAGCRFRTRCKLYERLGGPAECADRDPTLVERSSTHTVACHFHDHEDDGPSISLGSGTRSV